jgi:hypothetical protein
MYLMMFHLIIIFFSYKYYNRIILFSMFSIHSIYRLLRLKLNYDFFLYYLIEMETFFDQSFFFSLQLLEKKRLFMASVS